MDRTKRYRERATGRTLGSFLGIFPAYPDPGPRIPNIGNYDWEVPQQTGWFYRFERGDIDVPLNRVRVQNGRYVGPVLNTLEEVSENIPSEEPSIEGGKRRKHRRSRSRSKRRSTRRRSNK